MGERRKVWGLYDYGNKVWMRDNNTPSHRMRYVDGVKAYAAAETHGGEIQPRPFSLVTKPRTLDPKVQAVIDAARQYTQQHDGFGNYSELVKAMRALDAK